MARAVGSLRGIVVVSGAVSAASVVVAVVPVLGITVLIATVAVIVVAIAAAGVVAVPFRWVLAFLVATFGPAFGLVMASSMAIVAFHVESVLLLAICGESSFWTRLGFALFDNTFVVLTSYQSDYSIGSDCAV